MAHLIHSFLLTLDKNMHIKCSRLYSDTFTDDDIYTFPDTFTVSYAEYMYMSIRHDIIHVCSVKVALESIEKKCQLLDICLLPPTHMLL